MILLLNNDFAQLDPDPTTQKVIEQLEQLDGAEYLLRYVWQPRKGCWQVSIYDQDENPIALTIRLNVRAPLLRRFKDPRVPPGLLFCADMTGQLREIEAPTDLGSRVLLTYISADELPL